MTRLFPVIPALAVAVTATATATPLPEGAGREILLLRCVECHAADLVTTYRRTFEEWSENIIMMNDLGGSTTDEELSVLAEYLARHWGRDEVRATEAPAEEDSAKASGGRPEGAPAQYCDSPAAQSGDGADAPERRDDERASRGDGKDPR